MKIMEIWLILDVPEDIVVDYLNFISLPDKHNLR